MNLLDSLRARFRRKNSQTKTRPSRLHLPPYLERLEDRTAPAVSTINLSSLLPANGGDGSAGFVINGVPQNEATGYSVKVVGDLTGSGFKDLVIMPHYQVNLNGQLTSVVYVVYGKTGGFPAVLDLSTLDGTNGFVITSTQGLINSISSAGDVNGDGLGDLILGAPNATTNRCPCGAAYVIFGKSGGFGPRLDLDTLDGSNGFVIATSTPTVAGFAPAVAGADVNGDGFSDLIVGAPGVSAPGKNNTGAVYVVYGHAGPFAPYLDVSQLNGTNGSVIYGVNDGDSLGFAISTVGDVNGDGFGDLVLGTRASGTNGNHYNGTCYVLFGRAGGFGANFDLTSLNGANGFSVDGLGARDQLGWEVAGAGDVNGDGFSDVLLAAPGANAAYVIFGKASAFSASFDLSTLDGSNGFTLTVPAGAWLGVGSFGLAGGSDVNGDGFDDLLLGTSRYTRSQYSQNVGKAYVVFGHAGSFPAQINLDSLDGSDGFIINDATTIVYPPPGEGNRNPTTVGNGTGWSASLGDINGDGFADVLLGAPYGSQYGYTNAGRAFVLFGGNAGAPPILKVTDASGNEGTPIPLNITALAGPAGVLTLTLTIQGVPANALLSAGTDDGGGTWILTRDQLAGLTITVFNNLPGNAPFAMGITATSRINSTGETESSSATLNVTVKDVPFPTANQTFVAQDYLDLLHRPVDAGGLAFWSRLLDEGAARSQVVMGIIGSVEWRADMVQGLYHRYLLRDADPSGLNGWLALLAAGGTIEQVAAGIAGSTEYFQNQGGGTNDGFLDALYRSALGRTVDIGGRTTFDQMLAAGAGPGQVAAAIFGSLEYRQDLVEGFYGHFLSRMADSDGLNNWVSLLQQGVRDEQVIAGIVSSDEYLNRL